MAGNFIRRGCEIMPGAGFITIVSIQLIICFSWPSPFLPLLAPTLSAIYNFISDALDTALTLHFIYTFLAILYAVVYTLHSFEFYTVNYTKFYIVFSTVLPLYFTLYSILYSTLHSLLYYTLYSTLYYTLNAIFYLSLHLHKILNRVLRCIAQCTLHSLF